MIEIFSPKFLAVVSASLVAGTEGHKGMSPEALAEGCGLPPECGDLVSRAVPYVPGYSQAKYLGFVRDSDLNDPTVKITRSTTVPSASSGPTFDAGFAEDLRSSLMALCANGSRVSREQVAADLTVRSGRYVKIAEVSAALGHFPEFERDFSIKGGRGGIGLARPSEQSNEAKAEALASAIAPKKGARKGKKAEAANA